MFNFVSDMRECQEWIDTINFVAASYSAPCQLDATEQKRFQRPLLPASSTTLDLVTYLLSLNVHQIDYQKILVYCYFVTGAM